MHYLYLLLLFSLWGLPIRSEGEEIKLRFIDEATISNFKRFQGTLVGGLSGLYYNGKELLAVSDDKSTFSPARVYKFSIAIKKNKLKVKPRGVIVLKNKEGKPFSKGAIDFEAITQLPDKSFILTSEPSSTQPSFIYNFSPQWNLIETLAIPQKFLPSPEYRGLQNNKGFEAAHYHVAEKKLYVGAEGPLHQDLSVSSEENTYVRIIEYTKKASFSPGKEFLYPVSVPRHLSKKRQTVGLVEISSYENHLLTLERAYSPFHGTFVKIFTIDTSEATDISGWPSIVDKEVYPIKKTMLLDLNKLKEKLKNSISYLDNIEGMAIGPKTPSGNPTLILVSDNNFNLLQKTQFLAFEIIKE